MKVEFHAAADSELRAAANYYESRVPGLGDEFLTEVEAACSRLAELQARTEARCGASAAWFEAVPVWADLPDHVRWSPDRSCGPQT